MTQPTHPSLLPAGAPSLLPGGRAPGVPAPVALGSDPATQDALAQLNAREQAEQAAQQRRAELEGRWGGTRGGGATALTYFGKGVLDVILAPGALLGAAAEGVGSLTGAQGLEDFGRDLGRSSSGSAALPVVTALPDVITGDAKRAVSVHEQAAKSMAEQAEAWPMLSTASAITGEVAIGLALGGMASGLTHATPVAALEGFAGGAQTAYEKNAAYRDVLTTAGMASVLAAGMAYGVDVGVTALRGRAERVQAARDVFGGAATAETKTAARVTVDEAGGREAQTVINELAARREQARKAVLAAGDNPAKRQGALQAAIADIREELSEKAGKFEPARWAEQRPTALQKVLHRSDILDQVSTDVAQAAKRSITLKPGIDFDISPRHLKRLVKDADGPAAIGALQDRLARGIQEAPHTELGRAVQGDMRSTLERVFAADLTESMRESHRLAQRLMAAAGQADEVTASYAHRQAASLMQTMGTEPFGTAGKLYRQALSTASDKAAKLTDASLVRQALRDTELRGALPAIAREHSTTVAAALDAQARLAGRSHATSAVDDLHALEKLLAQGEEAVTLDGGPARRVIDWFRDKAEDRVIDAISGGIGGTLGGMPGYATGYAVSHFLRPRLGKILGSVQRAARRAGVKGTKALATIGKPTNEYAQTLASDWAENTTVDALAAAQATSPGRLMAKAATRGQQVAQFEARTAALASIASRPDALEDVTRSLDLVAPGVGALAAADISGKVQQLLDDMPKVAVDFRGKASAPSSEEVRLANAYWEATFDPGSVFEDLSAGRLDPDKVRYAWKQYPGLLHASRMGLFDILQTHMSEEEVDAIPDNVLTQLDSFFELGGALQSTRSAGFLRTVEQVAEQARTAEKPRTRKPLALPSARPTPVQRIASQRRA